MMFYAIAIYATIGAGSEGKFIAGMLVILCVLALWVTLDAGWIIYWHWVPPMVTFLSPVRAIWLLFHMVVTFP